MQTSIDRFLKYLRVERNASEFTIKSYREDLTALVEYLGDSPEVLPVPGEITTAQLRDYVSAMNDANYAKSTVARRLASLRSFFRFGQREGWAASNPAKALRSPRKSTRLPHFLSTDEIASLLEAPPADEPAGLRDRAMLETLYSAGLRVSELVGLEDGDLNFSDGLVRVRGKGRRERLAPIGSYAVKAIRRWQQARKLASDVAKD